MNPKYISSWTAHTSGIRSELDSGLAAGEIKTSDIVWAGPSGDYVIASDPAELDEDYADYTDAGTVDEYLHEQG